jgi:hypothetical protein
MADSLEDEFSPSEIASMAATYKALLNNPATRELTLRSTKQINPGVSIPEIDLKDQARGAFKETNDRMASLENQIRERDARDRVNAERSKLRESGLTNDDVAAIEKMMIDEQIPNYATAAKHYRNAQQLAEPTPNSGSQPGSTFELPKDQFDALKGGKAGLVKQARTAAEAAMAEIRSGRIKLQ